MRGWSPQVELCPPEARERALQVLYQRVPEPLRFSLIVEVLKDTARGLVDLSGLWIAWNQPWGPEWLGPRSQIIGAILTQALPGRAAAIWPPEVQPSLRRATTAAVLVQSALRDLQTRGFRIVQAVLDESASRRGETGSHARWHAASHRAAVSRTGNTTFVAWNNPDRVSPRQPFPRVRWGSQSIGCKRPAHQRPRWFGSLFTWLARRSSGRSSRPVTPQA